MAYNFGTENGVFELASGERAQRRSTIVRMLEGVRQSARPGDEAEDAAAPSFVCHHVTTFTCGR